MQIEETSEQIQAAAAAEAKGKDVAPGQSEGFEFISLGVTDTVFPKLHSKEMQDRFFKW